MRRFLTAAAVLAAIAAPTRAQVSAEALVGATWSSALVEDVIVNAITLQPQIAPSLAVSVGTWVDERYHIGGRIRFARSDLARRELGEHTSVIPLTVWTGTLVFGRRMWRSIAAEIWFGGIKYSPSGDTDGTIFQDGSSLLATLGLGVRAEHAITDRLSLGVHVGYDAHQFETQTLRTAGFTSGRFAHRVSVSATLRWSQRHATPS